MSSLYRQDTGVQPPQMLLVKPWFGRQGQFSDLDLPRDLPQGDGANPPQDGRVLQRVPDRGASGAPVH